MAQLHKPTGICIRGTDGERISWKRIPVFKVGQRSPSHVVIRCLLLSRNSLIPAQADLSGNSFICSVSGSVAGQSSVSGDAYVNTSFQYSYSHIWRNLGILIGFWVFFLIMYLLATELNSSTSSTADVLVFRRQKRSSKRREMIENSPHLEENVESVQTIEQKIEKRKSLDARISSSSFAWKDIVYDISIEGGTRRLLDHVTGSVRAGTLTALMGVSGAGKTTLLDVLAQRISVGVVTGDFMLNGNSLKSSFPRKTGI